MCFLKCSKKLNFFIPGTGTLDTDPGKKKFFSFLINLFSKKITGRTYDPRVRGWYTDAKALANDAAKPTKMVYTSPYRDFNGRGWMITLAEVVRDFETGTLIGVAGSDMLIETIQTTIQSIKFLDSGKITLFEDNGVVVADQEWKVNPNDPKVFTYKDLKNPSVSDELWKNILATPAGNTTNLNNANNASNYVISSSRLVGFGDKYLLVTFIPRSEVVAPMKTIVEEIDNLNLIISLVLVFVFLAISGVVVLLIGCSANQIQKPLEEMKGRIETVVSNIGSDDLGKGLEEVENEGLGDEEKEAVQNFNGMIQTVQRYKENLNTFEDNPFQTGYHTFIQPIGNNAYPEGAVFASAPTIDDLNQNSNNNNNDWKGKEEEGKTIVL